MKSCWGCGDDFYARWEESDLIPTSLVVEDADKDSLICPDCLARGRACTKLMWWTLGVDAGSQGRGRS